MQTAVGRRQALTCERAVNSASLWIRILCLPLSNPTANHPPRFTVWAFVSKEHPLLKCLQTFKIDIRSMLVSELLILMHRKLNCLSVFFLITNYF